MSEDTTDVLDNKTLTATYDFKYHIEIEDEDARTKIVKLSAELKNKFGDAARNFVEIGKRLDEVKSMMPHGTWTKWLQSEFALSPETARRFIRVSNKFKTVKLTDLWKVSPSALYLLSSDQIDDETREEFVEQAASGKPVTHAEVKRVIDSKREASITPGEVDVFENDEPEEESSSKPEPKKSEPEKPEKEWDEFNATIDKINSAYRSINQLYRQLLKLPPDAKDITNPICQKSQSKLRWTNTVGINNDQIAFLEGQKIYGSIGHNKLATVESVKIKSALKKGA